MSDPAKSEAIEDVLSSIRRLVSENHPATESKAAPVEGAEAPADAEGKLVLTPALRIADPDDPWRPISVSEETDDHDDPETAVDDDSSTDMSEDEIADDSDPEAAAADEAAAEAIAEIEAAVAETDGGPEEAAVEPGPFEPEQGDNDWPDATSGDAALDIAALRQARKGEPDQDEGALEVEAPAEVAEDDDAGGEAAELAEDHADSDEPAAEDHDLQEQAEQNADETDWSEPESLDEPVEAEEHAEAEPDTAPMFSRTAARDRVVDLGAQLKEPSGEDGLEDVEDLGEEPGLFTFPEQAATEIDEEVLREIVAEVVREEMQGILGQRITRNVRKMVRREIRMALAAEELE
ncbi:hypothetical protein GTA62_02470 [Roseobacter sp. HKCCD9010]|uniref:hypothetical protein n=1 Tax=unclassified Roseobacter TaxID=196798 RepID=UPI001492327D|nr:MULTISPECIES: hypothetical protein [unclassified Roseobacter]MBF9049270.1 hypothetical protein [Rhodobacterales bacterium HKCCD4356]NNV11270.1 hypothetical protein [Roseobacter sp. HKCCD7357]NNV15454.1 hypothetical protein [Roseobacter sp. HKCCD8768]NNV24914.1 hypothetical protein [Roseobacter sp. HKCCD8192]NNV29171.1 hypothetical protein [Roseobacter sp. HKCCD9061]